MNQLTLVRNKPYKGRGPIEIMRVSVLKLQAFFECQGAVWVAFQD